jgi:hypothetical protein
MSVLWNKLKVCRILLYHCIFQKPLHVNEVGRRQQKRAQGRSRAISPIAPEYPASLLNDSETEDFPAASSTVIYEEASFDEERSRTPIPDGAERGVAGPSKIPDMTGGKISHSQKSKYADDDHSDDQPREHAPPKIADLEPITEPEDSGEGKSDSQKKFKPTAALLPKSNKGI